MDGQTGWYQYTQKKMFAGAGV